jgi:type II secretory pathway component GspD/PulD (secretin)
VVPPPPVPEGQPAPKPLTPINQVQIQVWISETNEIGLRDIGANLQYTRVVRGKPTAGSVEQIQTRTFNPLNPAFNVTLPAPDTSLFPRQSSSTLPIEHLPKPLRPDADNNPANSIQTQSGAGMVMSIIQSGYGTIDGIFRGVEQKSDGDLISKPELLVIDNGIAEIHMGEQTPYQSVAYNVLGAGNLAVTWQDVGVNLKLQPLILSDDSIQINITQLAVSERIINRDIRGVDLPVFATRSQTGVVLVPNGQTLVIGGLSSRNVQQTERRVPIIGSIPILGIPFRGRNTKSTNSHLLIFVSPTVVNLRNVSEEAKSALNFWQDRRWENSERISKEIQVMQDEL